MDRRSALTRIAAMTGTVVVGADFFLSGCARLDKRTHTPFTATDVALLDEIGETIIPATDTAGAKAVGIGAFMVRMVTDCYDDAHHHAFAAGLDAVNRAGRSRFGKDFLALAPAERTTLLAVLDGEQREYAQTRRPGAPSHYFKLMKDLTLLGYFTSEVGCTQALRYVESPGRFDGDVPYHPGDRAWVNPARRA